MGTPTPSSNCTQIVPDISTTSLQRLYTYRVWRLLFWPLWKVHTTYLAILTLLVLKDLRTKWCFLDTHELTFRGACVGICVKKGLHKNLFGNTSVHSREVSPQRASQGEGSDSRSNLLILDRHLIQRQKNVWGLKQAFEHFPLVRTAEPSTEQIMFYSTSITSHFGLL